MSRHPLPPPTTQKPRAQRPAACRRWAQGLLALVLLTNLAGCIPPPPPPGPLPPPPPGPMGPRPLLPHP